jgi:hypothetical protein
METLEDILELQPTQFGQFWQTDIDRIVAKLPTYQEQIKAWECILNHISNEPVHKGHPLFRLGVLNLIVSPDEKVGIGYLEQACFEDQKFKPNNYNRMAAYRLLSLVRDFLKHLWSSRVPWQREHLRPQYRETLFRMLVTVYDMSLLSILDLKGQTYQEFFRLISDDDLRLFAGQNYYCAEHLLELWAIPQRHIVTHDDECPLARAVIGLLGGVLEALLAERLPELSGGKPLGVLINSARIKGIVRVGTNLAALSIFMLYFRNHIHAELGASRTEYFIDMNTAKGCKVALDWAMSELLAENENCSVPAGQHLPTDKAGASGGKEKSADNGRENQAELVACPDCGVPVRKDRLSRHVGRIHSQGKNPDQPARQKRTRAIPKLPYWPFAQGGLPSLGKKKP